MGFCVVVALAGAMGARAASGTKEDAIATAKKLCANQIANGDEAKWDAFPTEETWEVVGLVGDAAKPRYGVGVSIHPGGKISKPCQRYVIRIETEPSH